MKIQPKIFLSKARPYVIFCKQYTVDSLSTILDDFGPSLSLATFARFQTAIQFSIISIVK